MPGMQVAIFVEEGNYGCFTFAHHPYCVPAGLDSQEVHLQGEKRDMGSFLYLDPRTTEKPNVGCTEQRFCLLPGLQQPWKFTLCIAKGHVSLSTSHLILHWHAEHTSNTEPGQCIDENQNLIHHSILSYIAPAVTQFFA